jgi:hypothetical protein
MSLLRVSKFIWAEAAHYFYSTNTFVLLEDYPFDNDGELTSGSFAYDWYVKHTTFIFNRQK